MFTNKYKLLSIALLVLMVPFVTSCLDDLNTVPLDDDVTTSANVYNTPEDFRKVLAKLYAGFATTGQQGPAGDPDIQGIDEGFSNYVRQYWVSQEIPTDEAVVAWNDPGLPEFNFQSWGASNDFVLGMYSRIYFEIALANEFIRNANGKSEAPIPTYNAEARFLRALSYWHALDLYGGGVPFVTEEDDVGAFSPEPISAEDLFTFIETELKTIEDQLVAPGENEYARADQAAAWTLLTKLYLNAETYIDEERYSEAITYANKVIDQGGYTLEENYGDLFLADNHTANGIIFPIAFDGVHIKTFGGTTFITHAAIGGDMQTSDFGVDFGWAGHRVTPQFVGQFEDTETQTSRTSATMQDTDFPQIYVPGSFQSAGGYGNDWTPEDAPALASVNSDNTYEGFVFFNSDAVEYKFTNERNWNMDFGDNDADGTLEQGGANMQASEAGYYMLNADLDNMTHSALKTEWGIIGSATVDGWDADQDMSFDTETKTWTITARLSAGEMKFRANDAWDINFGDTGDDGSLELNGDNIQIAEAGTYTITLNLGTPPYAYSAEQSSSDGRKMFFTEGQTLEIEDIREFTEGYAVSKWKNITSTGQLGKDPTFVDTDFPMFRLADVYLMYAEAVLRGGQGGDMAKATQLVNDLRERAYGDDSNNISQGELTLNFILGERGRELYWEGHRRTDLVRYEVFTSDDYVWAWKGGIQEGRATSDHLRVYPIPASDINANPKLEQNPGY